MNLMSIGELASITGTSIRALRYYDEKGYLKPDYVDPETNYRYYSDQQLGTLAFIQMCLEFDIPLTKLKDFQNKHGYFDLLALTNEANSLLDQKISQLKQQKARLETLEQNILGLQNKKKSDQNYEEYFPIRYIAVMKFEYENPFSHDFTKTMSKLYKKIKQHHLVSLFNQGVMRVKQNGEIKTYLFVEVKEAHFSEAQRKFLGVLPLGDYQCQLYPFDTFKKEFESIWEIDMIDNEVILGLDLLDQNMNEAVSYIETQKFNFTI